jgi:hypothetical protein
MVSVSCAGMSAVARHLRESLKRFADVGSLSSLGPKHGETPSEGGEVSQSLCEATPTVPVSIR